MHQTASTYEALYGGSMEQQNEDDPGAQTEGESEADDEEKPDGERNDVYYDALPPEDF